MTEVDTTVLNILGKQVSFITTNGFHFFDNKGIVVHSGDITFPTTQAKVKILSSTTGTQINAGKYRVIISNAQSVDFETLEIQ